MRALRAETAICNGEITAADPGKWGHESKIHLLKSQLEQVTKERDELRQQLASVVALDKLTNRHIKAEVGDALEQLK